MCCLRCGGLLVPHDFLDLYGGVGRLLFQGWRCVNCGFVDDLVMRSNRMPHAAMTSDRPERARSLGKVRAM
jgi:hypothetical protein